VRRVRLPDGEQIPTLREFLTVARQAPMQVICEIKTHGSKEKDEKVIAAIVRTAESMGMGTRIEYTSFSAWVCDWLVRNRPGAEIIFISKKLDAPSAREAKERGYTGISYSYQVFQARPELFEEARALGVKTTYWTPDNPSLTWWGIEHRPDFISSNYPDKAKALVEAYANWVDQLDARR
jgi:glycerophosphoryl diester phosphodiesterase